MRTFHWLIWLIDPSAFVSKTIALFISYALSLPIFIFVKTILHVFLLSSWNNFSVMSSHFEMTTVIFRKVYCFEYHLFTSFESRLYQSIYLGCLRHFRILLLMCSDQDSNGPCFLHFRAWPEYQTVGSIFGRIWFVYCPLNRMTYGSCWESFCYYSYFSRSHY